MAAYTLNVNGRRAEVTTDPSTPLLWVLREDLKMTGTKYGCGIAACGACTVLVGGVATRSCAVPISLLGERPVVTIEGMATDPVGRRVQDAWVSTDVVQCGYCQSGQIMTAVALLKTVPNPNSSSPFVRTSRRPNSRTRQPSRLKHLSTCELTGRSSYRSTA